MTGSLQTLIRDLGRRRGRERRGLALAEGVRLIEEALAAGVPVRGAVLAPALEATPRGKALKAALLGRGARLEEVSAAELDALADTEHPQGVVAIVEPRRWTLEDVAAGIADRPRAPVLVLDGVQDPGNVGTILRTALGLGAAAVVALKGTAELANPKVMRGSMGALFRLPSAAVSGDEFLAWAEPAGLEIWVAAAGAPPVPPPGDRGPTGGPIALVLGNEGAGVSPPLARAASRQVAVPLAPGAESLNVAVAAGILLYQLTRERDPS